jgi:NADH:flavin oxidoreductases, Old Yellow Enzyme family
MQKYKYLSEPINIGNTFIKNRIAMAPMNDLHQFYDAKEGTINRQWVDYFTERAKGGVGLIITGVFKVEDKITYFRQDDFPTWALLKPKSIEYYSELARYCHTFGAKLFMQISAGPGRVLGGKAIDQGYKPISASENQAYFRPNVICRALTISEIGEIVKAFGDAASILQKAEIDGVEIHGHEGYLIDQFVTSLWNRRTDKYGGNLKSRLTFPIEILEAVKEKTGGDYPVIYRYGSKHFIKAPWKSALTVNETELGRDVTESIEIAKLLESAGYDALHIDAGCYESAYWAHPPIYMPHGLTVDLTSKVKKEVKIPVIAVGRLGIPALADKVIGEGKADIIALGRDLLADPYWPKKALGGNDDEIVPCIGCHECMNMAENGKFLTCAVNPDCGNEGVVRIEPASKIKNIVVIGAGVAGMQAAIIATNRGHNVSIYEKSDHLGGHLLEASKPDYLKKDIKVLLEWFERQIKKLNIKVLLNSEFELNSIKNENPDVIIVATGSKCKIPQIPGVDKKNVCTTVELLLEKKKATGKVAIIGGGLEGCETAVWLASKGSKVVIIEQLNQILNNIHRANRTMLLDLLEDKNVEIHTNSEVIQIEDNQIVLKNNDGSNTYIDCNTVVLAVGLEPENEVYKALLKEGFQDLYNIGDSSQPRKIANAVWEAYMLAAKL